MQTFLHEPRIRIIAADRVRDHAKIIVQHERIVPAWRARRGPRRRHRLRVQTQICGTYHAGHGGDR